MAGDVVDIVLWCEVARERHTEFGSPARVTEGGQDVSKSQPEGTVDATIVS